MNGGAAATTRPILSAGRFAPKAALRLPHRLRTLPANRRWLLALAGMFVCSRIVVHAVGVPFRTVDILSGNTQQSLPLNLLSSDLASSIWHLHSQPPLTNLATGILLQLPTSWQTDAPMFAFAGLGLLLVLAVYQTMVDLHVPPAAAWVTAALIAISPATILYENWLFYAYPSAAGMAFMALCTVRYLRTGRWGWGFGAFGSLAFVVLLNSTYQIEWLLAVVAVIAVARRHQWRQVVATAAVPVLVVGGWYLKDAVQFGTYTTSSWLGMNLTKTTLVAAPAGLVERLVRRGTLTPLAEVGPFSPVADYVPRFAPPAHTGVPALDETEYRGLTNLNNLIYVRVSQLYLHDDAFGPVLYQPGRLRHPPAGRAGTGLASPARRPGAGGDPDGRLADRRLRPGHHLAHRVLREPTLPLRVRPARARGRPRRARRRRPRRAETDPNAGRRRGRGRSRWRFPLR